MNTLDSHLDSIASNTGGPGRVAFFDLDRTLIAGYSILAMGMETARHAATRGKLADAAKIMQEVLRQRTAGSGGNYHKLVKRLARALTGVDEATLRELGNRAFDNSLARNLYPEAVALVEAHRAAGDHLVIVTAASRYQVEPVARILGIDEICCTQLEVQQGRFTGNVIAPLCYGEGKTMAARRVARKFDCQLKHAYFYSDASADLPLLKKVGHPVAVNPSEKLAVHARNKHWPQLHFASRGMPKLENIARTALVMESLLAATALGAISRKLGLDPALNANRVTRMVGDFASNFAGLELDIEGYDNLHRERPVVYIFNHQSLMDSVVLARLLRDDVVALCKKEMASKPIIGPMLQQVDTIFVDRDERDQGAVLKRALAALESGRSLVIAPEGTRSTLGDIQPFRHGAFLLAKKAGVPIVPIVLHNVKDALPKGAFLVRPARVRVTVLEPIPAQSITSVRGACRDLEDTYSELLGKSPQAALPHTLSA
ncbi:HAD-IB family hydrolase [Mangrovimicrobium sediminis]|uniref:HAD-IB family hydrolase n=1 Tax=Mangrovimicrobium sediminis TaxID=2562682 RepID=A0A4Z0M6Z1_9GAMM|nr:HAD-IB family hydrolase [Haliea sp. SAOS-164]TGD75180.1 HAD-IB family hydrolase [Haliea sp. SAOS-164]